MDTFSHIMIGAGLGVLAQIDPIISDNHTLAQAVMLGTVIGSNSPDFDIIYRLKGKGSYFRHHRGISHSLPALPIWSFLITSFIYLSFPDASFLHIFFWTFIAVIVHVLFDLLNVHGTQALWPCSLKWLSFDSIPLFDPYLLMLYIFGFVLIAFFNIGETFLAIHILIMIYLSIRVLSAYLAKKFLQEYFPRAVVIKLIPNMTMFKWNVIIETNEDFLFGVYSKEKLIIENTLAKKIDYPELVLETKNDPFVSDFLAGHHYVYPIVIQRKNGFWVHWKDLRFRIKKFFPYSAIMFISSDLKIKNSFIGKVSSPKHYKKVLKNLEKLSM